MSEQEFTTNSRKNSSNLRRIQKLSKFPGNVFINKSVLLLQNSIEKNNQDKKKIQSKKSKKSVAVEIKKSVAVEIQSIRNRRNQNSIKEQSVAVEFNQKKIQSKKSVAVEIC